MVSDDEKTNYSEETEQKANFLGPSEEKTNYEPNDGIPIVVSRQIVCANDGADVHLSSTGYCSIFHPRYFVIRSPD